MNFFILDVDNYFEYEVQTFSSHSLLTALGPGRKLSLEYGDNGWEEASKAQNAKAMAKYAAAMMRSLKEMDYDKFDLRKRPDFQLR